MRFPFCLRKQNPYRKVNRHNTINESHTMRNILDNKIPGKGNKLNGQVNEISEQNRTDQNITQHNFYSLKLYNTVYEELKSNHKKHIKVLLSCTRSFSGTKTC